MKEKTKKPSNYISIKESRKIIKYNIIIHIYLVINLFR